MEQQIDVNREQAKFSRMEEGEVRRDVYVMLETENIVTGITCIDPHSRTNGHAHPRREEHYYVLRGKGHILLDEERHEIQAGDDIYVPPLSVHTLVNPSDDPLEFFWVALPGEPKIEPPAKASAKA